MGFYSYGIKIDAIPGRINIAFTLHSLFKGEYRGFCYELCGQGHAAMISLVFTLLSISASTETFYLIISLFFNR